MLRSYTTTISRKIVPVRLGMKTVLFVYLFFQGGGALQLTVPPLTKNVTRIRRQPISNNMFCTLPPYPENGRWSLLSGNGIPGVQIKKNSVLKFDCDSGFKLSTKTPYLVCDENWNFSEMRTCEKLCPAITSTSTITVECVDKNRDKVDCSEATEGTYLSYTCVPYYEAPQGFKKNLLCLDGGVWNYPTPVCQPVCGKKTDQNAEALIYGGQMETSLEYPWTTAIYRKQPNGYLNICGGTIISRKVVLTAAHCVTNDYGDTLPATQYMVGAGKIYNKYGDSRDVKAQYLELSRIIVHSQYKGDNRNFLADIAVLVTKKLFILNSMIQPVCYNDLPYINIHAGDVGEIVGWGVKEGGQPSDVLINLKIPYKHKDTCSQELPREWADKYNLLDKICAGFFNKSMSVCRGDSGSGLVFKNPEDNRYYIHGIVSIGPSARGACNIQQNALYTDVAFYYEFIDREANTHYSEECRLPAYPANGFWTIENDPKKVPGDIATSNSILKVSCNEGFALASANSFVECASSVEMPTCQVVCPLINFPVGTKFKCEGKNKKIIDCAEAIDSTVLTYNCPEGYKIPDGTENNRRCLRGSWGTPSPECQINQLSEPTKVICSYASWQADRGVNTEDFDASLCTHVNYVYIGLWDHGNFRVQNAALELDGQTRGLYHRVTDMKKRNKNLKVLLSVGGPSYTNPSLFSSIATDPDKKDAFIDSAMYYIKTYNFDGLNIKWSYPLKTDKEDYISLLRDVKQAFQVHGFLLTASVRAYPDSSGYDGKRMNEILDWVNIMTYNMYGEWSEYTGIHSPLYASSLEDVWEQKHLNMDSAAKNWLKAGIQKSKLILSIAFFGRSFTLEDESKNGLQAPTTGPGPGGHLGFINYSDICSKYGNWTSKWVNEQKSTYIYEGKYWIGADNKNAVWMKAAYIKEKGFGGVNVWPVDGDDVYGKCGVKQVLLKHVHGGLGHEVNWDD